MARSSSTQGSSASRASRAGRRGNSRAAEAQPKPSRGMSRMCLTTSTAWLKLSARKKIQAAVSRPKVKKPCQSRSQRLFSSTPSRARSRRRKGPVTAPAAWYRPLSRPHTTKVQSAPCHRPLTANTMTTLSWVRQKPPRLPPRGKYRYSRNQEVREMCHFFQKSFTVADR